MRPRAEGPTIRPDLIGRRIRSARRNERERVRQEGGKCAAHVSSAENDGEISRLGLRKAIPVDGQRVTLQRLECQRRIEEQDLRDRRNPRRGLEIYGARSDLIRLEHIQGDDLGRVGCIPKNPWPYKGKSVCVRRRGDPKRCRGKNQRITV